MQEEMKLNQIFKFGKISLIMKCKYYNYLINFIKEIAIKMNIYDI